jgi:hypothetical protein
MTKISLFANTTAGNSYILASGSFPFLPQVNLISGYGALTGNTIAQASPTPKRYAKVIIQITSVSGTFSTGQGLTIQIGDGIMTQTVNSSAITSTGTIEILLTESQTVANVNGTQVSLIPMGLPQGIILTFNISGTSPSFGINAWVEWE